MNPRRPAEFQPLQQVNIESELDCVVQLRLAVGVLVTTFFSGLI